MAKRSMFVGMDVHKESIDIAVADGGRQGEVRHYGVIAGDVEALDQVVRALGAPNRVLHFVYEAGPCGFGIHRHLTGHGHECVVVSPSMVPKRSGDRVKTDRRDSVALARLHRAGELRAIYIAMVHVCHDGRAAARGICDKRALLRRWRNGHLFEYATGTEAARGSPGAPGTRRTGINA